MARRHVEQCLLLLASALHFATQSDYIGGTGDSDNGWNVEHLQLHVLLLVLQNKKVKIKQENLTSCFSIIVNNYMLHLHLTSTNKHVDLYFNDVLLFRVSELSISTDDLWLNNNWGSCNE